MIQSQRHGGTVTDHRAETIRLGNPLDGPLYGEALSDDRLYCWARWRFWNVAKPYINFVGLNPRAATDPIQDERIEAWLKRWEHGRERVLWTCGGYVVTNVFSRVAHTTQVLRRLNMQGVDVVGKRGADAATIFARKSRMVVMMPGIDEATDVREAHQALVLQALVGMGVPVAVVDAETQMPREWKL